MIEPLEIVQRLCIEKGSQANTLLVQEAKMKHTEVCSRERNVIYKRNDYPISGDRLPLFTHLPRVVILASMALHRSISFENCRHYLLLAPDCWGE